MGRFTTRKKKSSRGRQNPNSRKKAHSCTSSNRNYSLYIRRVLKEVAPQKNISSHTLDIMNSMISNIFDRISLQASNLMCYRNRCTLTPEDLQKAMYMLFPGKLARHAVTFGSEAVQRYAHSKNN